MIDKKELTAVIEKALEGSKMFLVDLKVSGDNVIDVQLDSLESITIDDCIAVNDAVHEAFDQETGGKWHDAVQDAIRKDRFEIA